MSNKETFLQISTLIFNMGKLARYKVKLKYVLQTRDSLKTNNTKERILQM